MEAWVITDDLCIPCRSVGSNHINPTWRWPNVGDTWQAGQPILNFRGSVIWGQWMISTCHTIIVSLGLFKGNRNRCSLASTSVDSLLCLKNASLYWTANPLPLNNVEAEPGNTLSLRRPVLLFVGWSCISECQHIVWIWSSRLDYCACALLCCLCSLGGNRWWLTYSCTCHPSGEALGSCL